MGHLSFLDVRPAVFDRSASIVCAIEVPVHSQPSDGMIAFGSASIGPRSARIARMAESITPLVEWLDGSGDRSGGAYVAMHRRLVAYFSRKGCRNAEELADETLTRVGRRLREEGSITDVTPAHYCYIVARYVFLEWLRDPRRAENQPADELPQTQALNRGDYDEALLATLDDCLGALSPGDRALLLEYYSGPAEQRMALRKALASRLGVTPNALAIRACRLRERVRSALASRMARD
jgi:hypothetical protein